MKLKNLALISIAMAATAFLAACQKSDATNDTVAGSNAAEPATNADFEDPAAPVASAGDCGVSPQQATAWRALIDEKPPIPEGGRPLVLEGKVELVQPGQMAVLTPGALEGSNQHFTLEIKPDPQGRASTFTVSTSVYPVPKATMAVIDCGGGMLGRVSIEHSS